MLRKLASDAGVSAAQAARGLSSEEDRCCQVWGQWQSMACDRAELDSRMAKAREAVAAVAELIRRRDAAS